MTLKNMECWHHSNLFNMETTWSEFQVHSISICGALRDLVLFGQFKKREKHPCGSVTFSKVAG